ncbi:TetR/AcrR family transcriptional regulator [Gramella sp. AN32]|uniref:TetR/AcrR family transcriptional regulator n=1 Tax=Christiangramia antarctica TaxID=2058158 RepID=A0ABW5X3D6_9FLAO|nr:TetR/AcrR family transcriptional regulator [Gramella sp. AN32]MCM4157833.1 TetR family transcriptional regulator [Gramella sp. AN32]
MEKDIEMLEQITALFIQNGAKTVTMDDISKEFGKSKKTLYKQYKSKEDLLEEVLSYSVDKILRKMRDLDEKIDNAVERMFARDEEIEQISGTNESVMVRQLNKYYPQIFIKHMLYFLDSFSEIIVHNIERGREQKLYRENFDAEMYAQLFAQLVMSYHASPLVNRKKISKTKYSQEALYFYMNAITTDKGKEVMEKLTL